jgi:hypothetical protein
VGFFSGIGFGIGEAWKCYSPWGYRHVVGVPDNVLRWFACVPIHGAWTVIAAACLWYFSPTIQAEKSGRKTLLLCVLVTGLAALIHGLYDIFVGAPCGILVVALSLFLFYKVVSGINGRTNCGVAETGEEANSSNSSSLTEHMSFYLRHRALFFAPFTAAVIAILIVANSLSTARDYSSGNSSGSNQDGSINSRDFYKTGYEDGFQAKVKGYDYNDFSNDDQALLAFLVYMGDLKNGEKFNGNPLMEYRRGYHDGFYGVSTYSGQQND